MTPGVDAAGNSVLTPGDTLGRYGTNYRFASPEQRAARRSMRMTGRGAYWGDVGGHIGGFAGGFAGMPTLGRTLGRAAGNYLNPYLKRITGRGLYQGGAEVIDPHVVTNDIVNIPGTGPQLASFGSDGAKCVHITHREFVGNVYAPPTSTFQNTSYPINPGLYNTFPWLSQIAQNYDEYTLVQCIFQYRSLVTDFAANNGQVGTVILATQYNNEEAAFVSSRQMLNYDGAMSCKTSQSDLQGVECDPSKLSMGVGKYIRTGPVITSQDLNTLDSGIFNLAIEGIPALYANQKMGELWVAYTVELRKPKEFSSLGLSIEQDLYVVPTTIYSSPSPSSTSAALQAALLQGQANNIGTTLEFSDTGLHLRCTLTLPEQATGNYELIVLADGTVAGGVQAPTQIPSNTPIGSYTTEPVPTSVAANAVPLRCVFVPEGSVTGIPDIRTSYMTMTQSGFVGDIQTLGEASIINPPSWNATTVSSAGGQTISQLTTAVYTLPPPNPPSVAVALTADHSNAYVQQGGNSLSSCVSHWTIAEAPANSNKIIWDIYGAQGYASGVALQLQISFRQYNPGALGSSGTPVLVNSNGGLVSI